MEVTMDFKIVTPNGVVYEDAVSKVTVPTEAGEITVLPHHNVLISVLKAGEVMVEKKGEQKVSLAISSGVLEVRAENALYLIADTAERAADIDLNRAEKARERAEELLAQVHQDEHVDFARIQAQIEKEMARIKVGHKYKDVK